MKLSQLCAQKKVVFSLEVFPPKRELPVESIYPALDRLAALQPDFISVTYGAGGSAAQQQVTCAIATHLKNDCGVTPLAHLTCINSARAQVDETLKLLQANGIQNVLALRGDRVPEAAPSTDFAHATDLIAHIHRHGGFEIAAACYPEGHPDSDSLEQEMPFIRQKVENGASHLISQLFFDNEDFYRMLELCEKYNIKAMIHAGIMPVTNAKQVQRMVSLCGAKLPGKFAKIMARYGDNPQALTDAGIAYATEQIIDLIASGAAGIHLYAMNNAPLTEKIHRNIRTLLQAANAQPPAQCG